MKRKVLSEFSSTLNSLNNCWFHVNKVLSCRNKREKRADDIVLFLTGILL
jgi:hypothetical protein